MNKKAVQALAVGVAAAVIGVGYWFYERQPKTTPAKEYCAEGESLCCSIEEKNNLKCWCSQYLCNCTAPPPVEGQTANPELKVIPRPRPEEKNQIKGK